MILNIATTDSSLYFHAFSDPDASEPSDSDKSAALLSIGFMCDFFMTFDSE